MALKPVAEYDENGHHFDVQIDEDSKVHVAVDGAKASKGYYLGGEVRFPKGITIDGKFKMSLALACDAELQAALAAN
ncbi:hypothetical protein ACFP1L_00390 [Lactiplantibacillus nangangensis]|uniref:SCP2 domain-containing protein n=1 Tax=Lactiplantibacillus nangangensis TaxID=2559917 RepID=A0ABW1SGB9_9LACO|nr:hypothetical protein [Lactiplantibacillus nangangensis]